MYSHLIGKEVDILLNTEHLDNIMGKFISFDEFDSVDTISMKYIVCISVEKKEWKKNTKKAIKPKVVKLPKPVRGS